jgi:two-component system cell cycle response regulator CtrA
MRILLGSPDQDRAGLLRSLGTEGRIAELAEPFNDLPAIAQHHGPFDVVVLAVASVRDQALPALRDVRRRGLRLPVLILAGFLTQEEEQEALNAGADDVLTRPVPTPILTARLQAVVRRTLGHSSAQVTCGNVTLDQSQQSVSVDGRPVRVTRREFDVLETLMLRRGMLLTKEHFMSRLYGAEEGPDQRILDVFVCKLRRKLAAAGAAEIVRTVWGRGYVVEEPGAAAVAAARERFAAGEPRARRAHLALGVAPGYLPAL